MSGEHKARVERVSYQTHLNATEVTVSVPGELQPERGEVVTLTMSGGAKK